jgi:hypothetical protein
MLVCINKGIFWVRIFYPDLAYPLFSLARLVLCNCCTNPHFFDTGAYNPYQNVIVSVGKILETYDSDKMYPVYGFGAKVRKPDGSLSECQHCFPVYGGGLEVKGVDGILQAYKDCVSSVFFSGPTLFAPIIRAAAGLAAGANCW